MYLLKWHTSDSKVHWANMGPTWVLPAQDGPHVGPMHPVIRDHLLSFAMNIKGCYVCPLNNPVLTTVAAFRKCMDIVWLMICGFSLVVDRGNTMLHPIRYAHNFCLICAHIVLGLLPSQWDTFNKLNSPTCFPILFSLQFVPTLQPPVGNMICLQPT